MSKGMYTVEPVYDTFPWTSRGMGYHRLWIFKDFKKKKKTLKLQISPKNASKLPLALND